MLFPGWSIGPREQLKVLSTCPLRQSLSTCPLRQRWDQSDGGELQLGQRSTNGSLEQGEGLFVQHVSLSQAVSGVYGAIICIYDIHHTCKDCPPVFSCG